MLTSVLKDYIVFREFEKNVSYFFEEGSEIALEINDGINRIRNQQVPNSLNHFFL